MSKFDRLASSWDEKPSRLVMAKRFGEAISESLELKSYFRLLDYGCGTGSCTIFLSEFVGSVVGIDASAPMLERFVAKTSELENKNFELIHANLEDDRIDFGHPDVIISTMTFHHLAEPKKILKHFYDELNSGGSIAIVDLDKEDGTFHDDGNEGVKHFGFERGEFEGWLQEIGFKNITHKTVHEIHKNDKIHTIFLMKGEKWIS